LSEELEFFDEPVGGGAVHDIGKDAAGVTGAVIGLDGDAGARPEVAVFVIGEGVAAEEGLGERGGFGFGVFGEDFSDEAEDAGSIASVSHDVDIEDGFAGDFDDLFEFEAGHGEEVTEFLGGVAVVDVFLEQ